MKNELGRVISACRKHCNYKQDYMAYKLGITTHSYANIENGRVDISTTKLLGIAKIFGVKAYQILEVAEEQARPENSN